MTRPRRAPRASPSAPRADRRALRAGAALVGVLCAGCASPEVRDLQRKLEARERQVAALSNDLAARDVTLEELRTSLLRAQNFDPDRFAKIYYPVALRIASLSGGADYDGQPGDDGVTVHLQPLDRDGHALKAAGDIRIQLFDLAAEGGAQQVGECRVGVDEAAKLWFSAGWTAHYTVKCPWAGPPPAHDEITIRATFTDYLTTNVITAQSTCRIRRAPGREP